MPSIETRPISSKRARVTLARVSDAARAQGGECLSQAWRGARERYRFRCGQNHEWRATAESILAGHWCPHCAGVARFDLAKMQAIASAQGGRCRSRRYVNTTTPLRWTCGKGHAWSTSAANVLAGHWCPACYADRRRLAHGLEQARALARERGGTCESTTYTNAATPLRWRCAQGHEWNAPLRRIKSAGSWCKRCAGTSPAGIEAAAQVARRHGIECLSTEYVNGTTPLRWRCTRGHAFSMSLKRVRERARQPCSVCKGLARRRQPVRGSLELFRRLATQRGGICLSDRYQNQLSPLRFRCAEGHEWSTQARVLRSGSWCPTCALAIKRLGLETMQDRAEAHGGRCLSMEYLGACGRLTFECSGGHRFERKPVDVMAGRWCPTCAHEDRRTAMLQAFDQALGEQGGRRLSPDEDYVRSTTPLRVRCSDGHEYQVSWAALRTGHTCRACRDGVPCVELAGLARHYGGECLERGVVATAADARWRCKRGHDFVARPVDVRVGVWCPECPTPSTSVARVELEAWLRARNAVLVTATRDASGALDVQCALGHTFATSARALRRGVWCPRCRGRRAHSIGELRVAAGARGGECLSPTYQGLSHKYLWRCGEGHEWRSTAENVLQRRHWCPECARTWRSSPRDLSIADLDRTARERGGRCVSTRYRELASRYAWECGQGHRWRATGTSVLGGSWCAACYGNASLDRERLGTLAAERGGRLASCPTQVSSRAWAEWECAQGHRWRAIVSSVVAGSWCRTCSTPRPDYGTSNAHAHAKKLGGVCLTAKVRDSTQRVRFRCGNGHVFRLSRTEIVKEAWCPRCAT